MPRFGAACPLWPLFGAFARPGVPLRAILREDERDGALFEAFAIAAPIIAPGYDEAPLLEVCMLIVPLDAPPDAPPRDVGTACRICPRNDCPGRREPSILAGQGADSF